MPTISDGTTTITPELVLGYEADQESNNVMHTILGRSDPDFSLAPASLRTGTLKLFFPDEAGANAARLLHAAASVFTYADTDNTTSSMRYVLPAGGRLHIALDNDTRRRWTLDVPFQEVL